MTPSSDPSYRQIHLTKEYFVVVDTEDYERVSAHKWCAYLARKGGMQIKRTIIVSTHPQRFSSISMRRFIMGVDAGDERRVELVDPSKPLDLRKHNLKVVEYLKDSKLCSRKDCHLAGVFQPLANFLNNPVMKGGRKSECKDCGRRDRRKWEQAHPEKMAAINERKRLDPKLVARNAKWRSVPQHRDDAMKRSAEWARNNRERIRLHSVAKRFRRQGVTQAWYEETLRDQDYKCAICGETCPPISSVRLAIDHDHRCCQWGRACDKCRRGLLCSKCNTALGHLEKTDWVKKARAYLQKYS